VALLHAYAYLTFVHFSWDMMEPVTYFTGISASISGLAWWTVTKRECTFEAIYDFIRERRRHALYRRAGFDPNTLETLEVKMNSIRRDITRMESKLKKPTCLQAECLKEN
jgi:hypothetical protein